MPNGRAAIVNLPVRPLEVTATAELEALVAEIASEHLVWCESIGMTPTEICNTFGFSTIKATRAEAAGVIESVWRSTQLSEKERTRNYA